MRWIILAHLFLLRLVFFKTMVAEQASTPVDFSRLLQALRRLSFVKISPALRQILTFQSCAWAHIRNNMKIFSNPTPASSSLNIGNGKFVYTVFRCDDPRRFSARKLLLNLPYLRLGEFWTCRLLNKSERYGLVKILSGRYGFKIAKSIIGFVTVNVVDLKSRGYRANKKLINHPVQILVEALAANFPLQLRIPGFIKINEISGEVFHAPKIGDEISAIRNMLKDFFHSDNSICMGTAKVKPEMAVF